MAQTVGMYLKQAVKARYTGVEAAAMVRLMRDGVCVPQLKTEDCVDSMLDGLRGMSLHHAAEVLARDAANAGQNAGRSFGARVAAFGPLRPGAALSGFVVATAKARQQQ